MQERRFTMHHAGSWIQSQMNQPHTSIRMLYRPLNLNIVHCKTRLFYCHGQFVCYECSHRRGREWGSANVVIQIGLTVFQPNLDVDASGPAPQGPQEYLHQFSLKGYRMRCKQCLRYAKPKLTYPNLTNLLKTVRNFLACEEEGAQRRQFERNIPRSGNSKEGHPYELCEACAKGKCRKRRPRRERKRGRGRANVRIRGRRETN